MANFYILRDYFEQLQEILVREEQEADHAFTADGRPAETNPHTEQWSHRYLALHCVNIAFGQFSLLLGPSPLPFDQRLGAVQQSLRNRIASDPDCMNIGVSADARVYLDAILSA
jgi:hypothetical protein